MHTAPALRVQIPMITKMLADEYGTASNIKSRVNRYVRACSPSRLLLYACVCATV